MTSLTSYINSSTECSLLKIEQDASLLASFAKGLGRSVIHVATLPVGILETIVSIAFAFLLKLIAFITPPKYSPTDLLDATLEHTTSTVGTTVGIFSASLKERVKALFPASEIKPLKLPTGNLKKASIALKFFNKKIFIQSQDQVKNFIINHKIATAGILFFTTFITTSVYLYIKNKK